MPLTPPGSYRKTRGIIRSGVSSDRPSAGDVLEGTLYYETDDRELSRSDGSSTWSPFGLPPRGFAIDVLISSSDVGSIDDWLPSGLAPMTIIDWDGGGTDLHVTGLSALTAASDGTQQVIFVNTGTNVAYFYHDDSGSSSSNRFHNIMTIAPTPVAARGYIAYVNNLSGWQCVGHDQGDVIGYSPAWTGSVSNPAIGNGVLGGFYKVQGRWIKGNITMAAGSTTTFGSGTWSFTYPFTISAGLLGVGYAAVGGLTYLSVPFTPTVTTMQMAVAATGNSWSPTVPGVWATNDAGVIMWDAQ